VNPWPDNDPLRLSEPAKGYDQIVTPLTGAPTVTLLDGEELELEIIPAAGFAYEWPAEPPQGNEET
jgi:hypothetical protein